MGVDVQKQIEEQAKIQQQKVAGEKKLDHNPMPAQPIEAKDVMVEANLAVMQQAQMPQAIVVGKPNPDPLPVVAPQQQEEATKSEKRQERRATKRQEKLEKQRLEEQQKAREIHEDQVGAARVLLMERYEIELKKATPKELNDYRPTENYSEYLAELQSLVLNQITDKQAAFKLYDEITTLKQSALLYDQQNLKMRFLTQGVTDKMSHSFNVENMKLIDEAAINEAEKLQEITKDIAGKINSLRDKVAKAVDPQLTEDQGFSDLSPEIYRPVRKKNIPAEEQARRQTMVDRYRQDHKCGIFEARFQCTKFDRPPLTEAERRYFEKIQQKVIYGALEESELSYSEAIDRIVEQRMKPNVPATLRGYDSAHETAMRRRNCFIVDGPKFTADDLKIPESEVIPKVSEAARVVIPHLAETAAYNIRIPNCDILGLILTGGRFKSQIETNTSQAALQPGLRKAFTERNLGADIDQMQPSEFEIYGYMSSSDLVKEETTNGPGKGCGQYGNLIVRLKKDRMKERTTFTLADSLSKARYVLPTKLTGNTEDGCDFSSFTSNETLIRMKEKLDKGEEITVEELTKGAEASYMELQFHGGVTIEDIESVTLVQSDTKEKGMPPQDQSFTPEVLEQMKRAGIQAFVMKGDKVNEV